MRYEKVIECRIVPTGAFKIMRGCSGCGCKRVYSCKGGFRVNANGNCLDIWLIYGCEVCGHTYNLPVYERIAPDKLPEAAYRAFLANDASAVFRYGMDKGIFKKNRVELFWDAAGYEVQTAEACAADAESGITLVNLENPYGIPVRSDKIVSGILGVSRSKVKELLKNGQLVVNIKSGQ